jgi:RNA polymerase sigma-70 factor (ECF subfamily)
MKANGASDAAVVKRVLDGDGEAYRLLVERHQARVFAILSRYVPADRVAEVAQDAFVRAFSSLAGFDVDRAFDKWLAGIAVRAAHDFWRAHYRNPETPLGAMSEEMRHRVESALVDEDRDHQPGEGLEHDETLGLLDAALGRLAPVERMVLTLVHLEERSVAETAELMGLSRANVKVRAHRARKKLRAVMDDMLDSREKEES